MIYISKRQIQLLVIILGVFSLILAIWWNLLFFHITSIDPKPPKIPTSTQFITIRFNKDIDNSEANKPLIILQPQLTKKIVIKDKAIEVTLSTPLTEGQKLTMELQNIHSKNGDVINKTLVFQATYIAPRDQSAEQRNKNNQASNSFESSYPLVKLLPYRTFKYSITYRFPNSGSALMPIVVSMNFSPKTNGPDGTITTDDMVIYRDDIKKYRTEALEYLKKNNFSKKIYQLYFSENELLSEFDGKYVGELVVE